MKRILIVGCPGAGKSTFGRAVQQQTGLPLTHLDTEYFNPKTQYQKYPEAWKQKVSELAATDKWIIEGFHATEFVKHAARADVIIFLDYSRWIVAWRIIKRGFQTRFRDPPEMPDGWREVFNTSARQWLFDYVLRFKRTFDGQLDQLLRPVTGKERLIFTKPEQAQRYLRTLQH